MKWAKKVGRRVGEAIALPGVFFGSWEGGFVFAFALFAIPAVHAGVFTLYGTGVAAIILLRVLHRIERALLKICTALDKPPEVTLIKMCGSGVARDAVHSYIVQAPPPGSPRTN